MNDNSDVRKSIQTLIDNLMDCEKNKRQCKKCKKKDACLIFMRDCIAAALQFILVSLPEDSEIPEGVYT